MDFLDFSRGHQPLTTVVPFKLAWYQGTIQTSLPSQRRGPNPKYVRGAGGGDGGYPRHSYARLRCRRGTGHARGARQRTAAFRAYVQRLDDKLPARLTRACVCADEQTLAIGLRGTVVDGTMLAHVKGLTKAIRRCSGDAGIYAPPGARSGPVATVDARCALPRQRREPLLRACCSRSHTVSSAVWLAILGRRGNAVAPPHDSRAPRPHAHGQCRKRGGQVLLCDREAHLRR